MALWKGAVGVAAAVSVCACQLVSGLDDLEARGGVGGGASSEDAASASGTHGSGGSGSGSGSGGGGGGGGAGGMNPCSSVACLVEAVPNTQVPVHYLAIDANYLYWAWRGVAVGDGSIWRAPLDSMEDPELLASNVEPSGLAVDTTKNLVYWIDSNEASGVHSLKSLSTVNVGSPMDVETSAMPVVWRALARTPNDEIFWADSQNGNIRKINFGPYFFDTGAPFVLASDATRLFWFDGDSIDTALLGGMGRSQVAPSAPGTYGVAVDDEFVYWTVKTAEGSVWGNPKAKIPAQGTLLAGGIPYPSHIFADGKSIYLAVEATASCEQGGGLILRLPAALSVGSATHLASAQVCPSNFVKSASHVYWGSGTKIYRVNQ